MGEHQAHKLQIAFAEGYSSILTRAEATLRRFAGAEVVTHPRAYLLSLHPSSLSAPPLPPLAQVYIGASVGCHVWYGMQLRKVSRVSRTKVCRTRCSCRGARVAVAEASGSASRAVRVRCRLLGHAAWAEAEARGYCFLRTVDTAF